MISKISIDFREKILDESADYKIEQESFPEASRKIPLLVLHDFFLYAFFYTFCPEPAGRQTLLLFAKP